MNPKTWPEEVAATTGSELNCLREESNKLKGALLQILGYSIGQPGDAHRNIRDVVYKTIGHYPNGDSE